MKVLGEEDELSEKPEEKTIIDLITDNPKSTTKNMISTTGLTRSGIEYQLNRLKESGKIERICSDKGGYRKVILNLNK